MKYLAKGTHNSHFELFDDQNNLLGKLDYTKWFTIHAEIHLPDGSIYKIAPSNIWHTSLVVTKNDVPYGNIKLSWLMQVIVSLETGEQYFLKHKGLINRHYVLVTEQEKEVVALHPNFQWSKMSFNYNIETDDNYPMEQPALLLFLIYCANFIHSQQMSGGIGAVV